MVARAKSKQTKRPPVVVKSSVHKPKTVRKRRKELLPPTVASSIGNHSIHRPWKQPLGGLIRWYMHKQKVSDEQAHEEIERLYFLNNCCPRRTRDSILQLLSHDKSTPDSWIDLAMVIDKEDIPEDLTKSLLEKNCAASCDRRGILLRTEDRQGEGPAHSHETWKTALVPDWAVDRSYYFQVQNNSSLPLSCEMTIDDKLVARNAPVPPRSTFTIKPDQTRYFQSHQWRMQTAPRTKVYDRKTETVVKTEPSIRYNEKRPVMDMPGNDSSGAVDDSSCASYPDPTHFGWRFTGSDKGVSFFEQKLNLGMVLLDFEYTTKSLTTTLRHPVNGDRVLISKRMVSIDTYQRVLKHPRTLESQLCRADQNNHSATMVKVEETTVEGLQNGAEKSDSAGGEVDMETEQEAEITEQGPAVTYYAKNEKYDFEQQGHVNRKEAMKRLEPTAVYQAWEESARKEWACVHAKFFVALPRRRGKFVVKQDNSKRKSTLPNMSSIVDTKATERAVLATQFHTTGPSQPRKACHFRMERINGLKDDRDWKASPVLEYKLYYRAEDPQFEDDDDSCMGTNGEDDNSMDAEDTGNLSYRLCMRGLVELGDYRAQALMKIENWHTENRALDPETAEAKVNECRAGIQEACSKIVVDEKLQKYWEWHQSQHWDKGLK